MGSAKFIRLSANDNVIVMPGGGTEGDVVAWDGEGDEWETFFLRESVPPWHKAACTPIAKGERVIKFGRAIGLASRDIGRGNRVHTNNVETLLASGGDELPKWRKPPISYLRRSINAAKKTRRTFKGYRREDGRAGIRNELWVIPTVGSVCGELEAIVRDYHRPYWIDSVKVLGHASGASQTGDDLEMTANILAGLATNPNAAGALLVGLGNESLSVAVLKDRVIGRIPPRPPRMVTLQTSSAENIAEYLDKMAAESPRTREEFPLSDLCVGVKCGENDGFSGISANPLVGRFADWLVSQGGTILAAEIPEMFGAEKIITSRICSRDAYDNFISLDSWFREYFARHGQPILKPISPGRGETGISTPEERSLGAIQKTGLAPVTSVLKYGEGIRDGGGVQITFAPCDDLVSCTALAGGGAQIILFTTDIGAPFGSVVPTVKISADTALRERLPGWIDFNAGVVLDGASWETAAADLTEYVLKVASGEERTAHERRGHGEISIFRDGAIF
ncbi:MAG: altronate dehydratase family protein [Synergistaceae bacterium]|nr:altronate dehydratase family protein [Synergistaceae bacterium]